MKTFFVLPLLFIVLFISCAKKDIVENSETQGYGWLVPTDKLVIHENAHDKIQSIDDPVFLSSRDASIASNEEVLVFQTQDQVRIYPVNVLWHHEIVNDRNGDDSFTVSFCPLTGSGIAWGRQSVDQETSFGVSGHLYNSNLVAYDRATESYWSQMTLQGIKGPLGGEALSRAYLLRTTYATAIEAYPEAGVLFHSTDNGQCDSICPPQSGTHSGSGPYSFPANAYFGIVFRDEALLFGYQLFTDSVQLIRDRYKGNSFVVAGSKELGFVTAFSVPENISLQPLNHQLPDIMADSDGNRYDIMGNVTSGPRKGQRLSAPLFYSANSFAWGLFFQVKFY